MVRVLMNSGPLRGSDAGWVDSHKRTRAAVESHRAGMGAEGAHREPLIEATRQLARTLDVQAARTPGVGEAELSKVHARDAFEVGPDHQVVAEARVAVAEIGVVASQNQPVASLVVAKLEPNH